MAPRPPGVPDSAVSIGPRLCALAVYLLVFQHLPVERCRLLLSDVAGAEVSAGFIHSCLARAASMAAGVVKLIKTLIIASRVVGFDETTLRSGAAGEKKYVHGAFTEKYSLFHLGTRSLDTMKDFGILAGFARIAVTDRYGNYFHATWKNISGHQACISHILRDLQDCAETYPGTISPGQAQDALRALIHARNQPAARLRLLPDGLRTGVARLVVDRREHVHPGHLRGTEQRADLPGRRRPPRRAGRPRNQRAHAADGLSGNPADDPRGQRLLGLPQGRADDPPDPCHSSPARVQFPISSP